MSVQQVPIKTYKVKPMQPETQEKVRLSLIESTDLSERELRCPYCRRYIATAAKCGAPTINTREKLKAFLNEAGGKI